MRKLILVCFFIIILFLFINNFSYYIYSNDIWQNLYFIKNIENTNFKLIISNQVIFYLLLIRNLGNSSSVLENKKIDDLFNRYYKKFDFSHNDTKSLHYLYNLSDFYNLKNLNKILINKKIENKDFNPNTSLEFESSIGVLTLMEREIDVFLKFNSQIINDFYNEMFEYLKEEFVKYNEYLNKLNIDYLNKLIFKSICYVEFVELNYDFNKYQYIDVSLSNIRVLYFGENIENNFYSFLKSHLDYIYHANEYSDYIYNLFLKKVEELSYQNNLDSILKALLKLDESGHFFIYNYKGFEVEYKYLDQFYFDFVNRFFHEFLILTFTSYLLNTKLGFPIDKYLYIDDKTLLNSELNKNLYYLQDYLVNSNPIYTKFSIFLPEKNDIYKLFLLFFYTQIYGFKKALNLAS